MSKLISDLLLGDGYISKSNRFGIHHSKKQIEWFWYKARLLLDYGYKFRVYTRNDDFIRLDGTVTQEIKSIRKLFYPNNYKIIPRNIQLDMVSLAILFMDDGRQNTISHYNSKINGVRKRIETNKYVNRYEIATHNYTEDDIYVLISFLSEYDIESKILYQHGYPILSISKTDSKNRFYEGIKPYVIESMKYKLSAKPSLSYIHGERLSEETVNN